MIGCNNLTNEIINKDTLYDNELYILRDDCGLTYKQIAELLHTKQDTIKKVIYGQLKCITRRTCIKCGQIYYGPPHAFVKECARAGCRSEKPKKPSLKETDETRGRIREYTDTSLLLIASYLADGYSIDYIARECDRDRADLAAYIDRQKASGKLQAMIRFIKNQDRRRKRK